MREEGIPIDNVRVDEPTLENTFVATLPIAEPGNDATLPSPRATITRTSAARSPSARNISPNNFGSFTAVHDVSLQVRYGEIYGLLGANGAGKTTTIKMLCGLLERLHGKHAAGGRARRAFARREIRQQIGYMSQKFSLYDDLSIVENLDFFGGVYGVPAEELKEKERWVLDFSGLEGKEQQVTGSLPGGWKQRVAFGSAIMHEPGIVFLDEPTSGVDPLARRAFWTMINHLADAGTAVLVTTHYLEEAEQCNRLGFMVAGELLVEGTPSEIKAQQKGHLLEFRVDQPQRAADLLKSETQHWRVALFGEPASRHHRRRCGCRHSRVHAKAGSRRSARAGRARRTLLAGRRVHQRGRAGPRARQDRLGRLEELIMRRIFAQARKELTQLLRDRLAVALALLLP